MWKFIGVPESVPIPITAPLVIHRRMSASAKNICRSVVLKYWSDRKSFSES
jgi:hypothetical protein